MENDKELGQHLDTVAQATSTARRTYFTLLLYAFYLTITVLSVTDIQLLRQSALEIPLVKISLPLLWYFILAPLLLLVLHLHLLLQLRLLSRSLRNVDKWIRRQPDDQQNEHRSRIPTFMFNVMLAALPTRKTLAWLIRLSVWLSIVVFPLASLVATQFSFNPHQGPITWYHALLVFADVALILAIWPETLWKEHVHTREYWINSALITAFAVLVVSILFHLTNGYLVVSGQPLYKKEADPSIVAAVIANHEMDDDYDVRASVDNIRRRLIIPINLTGRNLSNAQLEGVDLQRATLKDADLDGAKISDTNLTDADLRNASLVGVEFRGVQLDYAKLESAQLTGGSFESCSFRDADLKRATLDGSQFEQTQFTEAYMVAASLKDATLHGVDMSHAYLLAADLTGAQMCGSILRDAVLVGTRFNNTTMLGSDFSAAQLFAADFRNTDMCASYFDQAEIYGAYISEANLNHCDLRHVDTYWTPTPNDWEALEKEILELKLNWWQKDALQEFLREARSAWQDFDSRQKTPVPLDFNPCAESSCPNESMDYDCLEKERADFIVGLFCEGAPAAKEILQRLLNVAMRDHVAMNRDQVALSIRNATCPEIENLLSSRSWLKSDLENLEYTLLDEYQDDLMGAGEYEVEQEISLDGITIEDIEGDNMEIEQFQTVTTPRAYN